MYHHRFFTGAANALAFTMIGFVAAALILLLALWAEGRDEEEWERKREINCLVDEALEKERKKRTYQ